MLPAFDGCWRARYGVVWSVLIAIRTAKARIITHLRWVLACCLRCCVRCFHRDEACVGGSASARIRLWCRITRAHTFRAWYTLPNVMTYPCMCDMTHSHMWRDSILRVTWLIHTFYMAQSKRWYESYVRITALSCRHVSSLVRTLYTHDLSLYVSCHCTWLITVQDF